MCGIIGVIKKEDDGIPTQTSVLDYYRQQISRGTQGYGYIAFDETLRAYIRRQDEASISKALASKTARSIMFHHRIPTSTPNYSDTTHPIKVSHDELMYDYYVVHNGMISNDTKLHDEHVALGYEYNTTVVTKVQTATDVFQSEEWNDSEAFAIDLVRFIEGKQEEMKSKGSIAFICTQVNKESGEISRIFWGHNAGNPLTMHKTATTLILRSIGEAGVVKENEMYCIDYKTWEYTSFPAKIGEYLSVKNSYGNSGAGSYFGQKDYGTYGRYDIDDEGYGTGKLFGRETGEDEIITCAVDKKIRELEDELDEIAQQEEMILADIEYYEKTGYQVFVNEKKIELIKNRQDAQRVRSALDALEVDMSTVTT